MKWNKKNWIDNKEISYERLKFEFYEINRNLLVYNKNFKIEDISSRWHKDNNLREEVDICFNIKIRYKRNIKKYLNADLHSIEYKNFNVKSIEVGNNNILICGNFNNLKRHFILIK